MNKTFEQRAIELAAGLSGMAKAVVPTALITLLIDICKTLDHLNQDKS
ncbi:hypothetical protein [Lacisediminimonas profundi]|nr:hypothetical protein [Lacisediminimonas profundi]